MQLEMAAAVYAKAWGDAEATRARGHTPLPHQTVALERAGAALERRPEGAHDLDRALEHDPGLAARGVRDRVALVAAMTHEGRWRTEPGYRAEHYGQAWRGLEQAYAAAHRPVERATVRGRMETFVDRLERDTPPVLDGFDQVRVPLDHRHAHRTVEGIVEDHLARDSRQ